MLRRVSTSLLPVMALGALLVGGCEGLPGMGSGTSGADTTRAPGVPPPGEGLVTVSTGRGVAAVTQQLESAIQSSSATLVAEINHAQNAGGDSLRPMRLLVFGNPQAGTPLMQSVQTAGLDLPQKMLIWRGADDSTRVTYNLPDYLAARHDLEGAGASLRQMGDALASLAEQAAGRAPDTSAFNADSISAAAGLAVETSDFGAQETFRRLRKAVQANPQLSVMAEVNHAQNAAGVGDSLRFTRLLMVGNPQAGTPLMRKAPTMGVDLPQKMLVWEGDEGNAFVGYNEPAYLARRHQLADTTGLSRIARALDRLAFTATSNEEEIQQARPDSLGMG